ncbi:MULTISPECIES: hypothetical protein [Frankia]|nr:MULTISPECIES: hypothetical protein [Frankia]
MERDVVGAGVVGTREVDGCPPVGAMADPLAGGGYRGVGRRRWDVGGQPV